MFLKKCLLKKNYLNLILMLGFPYGTILIFSAYGPGLKYTMGPNGVNILSTLFLIFLVISMLLKPAKIFKIEEKDLYLYILIIVTVIPLFSFYFLPTWAKWFSIILLAFTEGRIAVFWSRSFLKYVPKSDRGFVITAALFIAYGSLYLGNLIFPSLPPKIITIAPGLSLLATIPFFKALENKLGYLTTWRNEVNGLPVKLPLVVFLIIYISAGVTFSGIFPYLNTMDRVYRYYNVLPFVLFLPIINIIQAKVRRYTLISIGSLFLGSSYILLIIPLNNGLYFIIETLLQVGWAFLNTSVWIIGADVASLHNKSQYQTYFVASFLFGTFLGALIYMILSIFFSSIIIIILLSQIPLLIGLQFLIPILNKRDKENHDLPPHIKELLTTRELELSYILNGYLPNQEIADKMAISTNTLKTHIKNIYRKSNTKTRSDFRKLFN